MPAPKGCGVLGQIIMLVVVIVRLRLRPQLLPDLFKAIGAVAEIPAVGATAAAMGSVASQVVAWP